MTSNALRALSVGVDIEGVTILDQVTLTVSSGQLLVITGASGSGKTTLAHVLAGLVEPDRGEVVFDETPLHLLKDVSTRLALVPQDFGLVSTLTAYENVALPLQVGQQPKNEQRERSERWLALTGLGACANRPVDELSGGQHQRVAIARAFAIGASVIIMDEPTAELDHTNRDLVLSLVATERERGAAIVVVSHDDDILARANAIHELPLMRGRRIAS